MKAWDNIQKLKKKEDGTVVVLVALFIVILLGMTAFALDLGSAYHQSSKLQNALDSAALAGAQELPADNEADSDWTDAKVVAEEFAVYNGYTGVTCQPVHKNGNTSEKIIGIQVNGSREVEYQFAGVFGVEHGDVSKSATAQLFTAVGMSGLVPLSLTEEKWSDIDVGEDTIIKFDNKSNDDLLSSGWYGPVRIDGSGATEYRDDFKHGCSTEVHIGDVLEMETGNMVGPTEASYEYRISGHESCTYNNHEGNCPRVVVIPIVKLLDTNKDLQVLGFATLFLKSIEEKGGNECDITAVFLEANFEPDATPGTAIDYGVYKIKLTD
ncbi:MAG: pilus assembly protein TadG-related protein [Bacillota bacterium]